MRPVALWPVLPLLAVAPACGSAEARVATEVVLDARYSKFSDNAVTVRRGVPITFVIRNDDPIEHELIVGDADLQRRHETGTEPAHGDRPGEVSVAAGETATTTLTFDQPGLAFFACHLPGHYRYGMRGTINVVR